MRRSAAVVIAITLQRLVDDATRMWTVEEQLVLDALRRSTSALNDASIGELADYVRSLSPEQLRGVASNVKGIFHELLFVNAMNLDGDEISARVFEATNHPGADVEFIMDGEVIREVQLKAVATASAIYEHLARYPEIEVVATAEVAAQVPGIVSSGFQNSDLNATVGSAFSELPGDSLAHEIAEGIATSALVSGALTAGRLLAGGRVSGQQFKSILGDAAVGTVTAASLDALLDGLL